MSETKRYLPFLLILAGGAIFFPYTSAPGSLVGGAYSELTVGLPIAENERVLVPVADTHRTGPAVSAGAVLVKDVGSGVVLLAKNIEETVPIASLTKLMTALVAANEVSPQDLVLIEVRDTNVVPYSVKLVPGEYITTGDLLKAMLISSANDASMALARHSGGTVANFVRVMNIWAKELGMMNTAFTNPVGFDHQAHYSTAEDLSILVDEFLQNDELLEVTGISRTDIFSADGRFRHRLVTTNQLLDKYEEVIGLKTGYTEEAKGNLIILVQDGEIEYYAIVLGSDDREKDAEIIFNWVKDNFEWK